MRQLCIALTLLCLTFAQRGWAAPPNVVCFLADDHAAQAIGCYGGRLMKTPNIDRLAAGGMRFDRCFCTESICGPSRAAILTGKYGHVSGAMGWRLYNRQHRTFPELLQAGGYQTALVGKYHQGVNPPGFDYYDIFPGQGQHINPQFVSKQGKRTLQGHSSDLIAKLGLDWLAQRDKTRPFLLCLHDKATHMPWLPAPRFESMFADAAIPEPATLFDDYAGRPTELKWSICRVDGLNRWQSRVWGDAPAGLSAGEQCRWQYQQYMKNYLRCAAGLDENIGRVLDYLDREQLAENTLVVYSSDQGFFLGEHGWFDKRWMLEESLRMPLVIRYPKLVKPASASDALTLNVDFAPTLVDLAGFSVPGDMQGRSLRPLLAGKRPADWRKSIYYRYYPSEYGIPPQLGVRTERYKLIHYSGPTGAQFGSTGVQPLRTQTVDQWELFDLAADPDERVNLYQRPDA